MKNIAIVFSMCAALIATAPQVQSAPKSLTVQQKQTYSERAAALPASFGQEQGEFDPIIGWIAVAFLFAAYFALVLGTEATSTIAPTLSTPSSGGGTTSHYNYTPRSTPGSLAPMEGYVR